MCGIVAILALKANRMVLQCLVEGIKMLQNRGYDSCGGTLLTQTSFWTWKGASKCDVSAVTRLEEQIRNATDRDWSTGCFQTRWATHGAKTDQNAHPHYDHNERFYVVHNGIITNYAVLKERLVKKGYIFRSETDTEVVAHLMADCLASKAEQRSPEVQPMLEAWRSVVGHLEGTWSLIMTDRQHPEMLYVAKNGSPLLMSYSEDEDMVCFSSELHGIRFRTRQYEEIPDGAVFVVSVTDNKFEISGLDQTCTQHRIDTYSHAVSPHPYPFWTELEINQQKQTLWDALNHGGRLYADSSQWHVKLGGLDRLRKELSTLRHLVLVGCGTSLNAALFAAPVFREISQFTTVQVFDASEITQHDLPLRSDEDVGLVLISQSGETKDCLRVMEWAKALGCLTIGVVNVVGSSIARQTDCGVYLNAGREVGVASTKSFTSQCMVLTLLAMWFSVVPLTDWGPRVYNLPSRCSSLMAQLELAATGLVSSLAKSKSIFILGRGYSHPIALEGALKLKELTYQNVEGYPGGALKHGPFAVLDPDCMVFIHVWTGPNVDHMLSCAEQVTSRGARIVLVHNLDEQSLVTRFPGATLVKIHLPDEWSASLASVVFYQFLAYHLARFKGHNPDYPRNLAKVVTVDG